MASADTCRFAARAVGGRNPSPRLAVARDRAERRHPRRRPSSPPAPSRPRWRTGPSRARGRLRPTHHPGGYRAGRGDRHRRLGRDACRTTRGTSLGLEQAGVQTAALDRSGTGLPACPGGGHCGLAGAGALAVWGRGHGRPGGGVGGSALGLPGAPAGPHRPSARASCPGRLQRVDGRGRGAPSRRLLYPECTVRWCVRGRSLRPRVAGLRAAHPCRARAHRPSAAVPRCGDRASASFVPPCVRGVLPPGAPALPRSPVDPAAHAPDATCRARGDGRMAALLCRAVETAPLVRAARWIPAPAWARGPRHLLPAAGRGAAAMALDLLVRRAERLSR